MSTRFLTAKAESFASHFIVMILIMLLNLSQVQAQGYTKANVQRIVQQYTGVWNSSPKNVFSGRTQDTPMLGNGDVGVIIGGTADKLSFYIGKNEWWSLVEGRCKPVGRIAISIPEMSGATYHMEQDIAKAEVRGAFTRGNDVLKTTSWVSATDNLLITKLTYDGSSAKAVTVKITDPFDIVDPTKFSTSGSALCLDLGADDGIITEIGMENWFASGPRYYFNGKIDEFGIYNRVITDAEVTRLYNQQPVSEGIIKHFSFDTAIPEAHNTTAEKGKINNCFAFNGKNSWVNCGQIKLRYDRPHSIGGWIYLNAIGKFNCILNQGGCFNQNQGGFDEGVSIGIVDGHLRLSEKGKSLQTPGALNTGEWIHFVGTFDGQVIKLYINGSPVATKQVYLTAPVIPKSVVGRLAGKIIGASGKIKDDQLTFTLQPGKTVTLVTSIISNTDNKDYKTAAVSKVNNLSTLAKVEALNLKHRNWWQNFYSKSFIEIPDKTIEKMWYGSQYLLACENRKGEYCPGIFGNWNAVVMIMGTDMHTNYNYQAVYYGSYISNHIDLTEPYDTCILEWMPNAKKAAIENGFKGVYYPVGLGPLPNGSYDSYAFFGQKTDAVWCTANMLMRFYATYDKAYVNKVYAFLKECGLFWENYLVWDGKRYVIVNDSQNEGTNYPQTNGVMSLGFVKYLFKGLVDISSFLNIDETKRATWQNILNKISDFPTTVRNGKKVFRLTEVGSDGTDIATQHIHPAMQVGLSSDTALIQISKNTISMLKRGWTGDNHTQMFMPAAAMIGYSPETILRKLRAYIDTHVWNNMHIIAGGGGLENLSLVPSTIGQMFLQSHQGELRIFPNWPSNIPAKYGDLRAEGAFLVSSEIENNTIRYVRIISEKGRNCVLYNPWPGNKLVIYRNGIQAGTLSGEKITIKTSPNETIHIAPTGITYSDLLKRMDTNMNIKD